MEEHHTIWMNNAAKLAYKAARKVFPNPMVGAILVKDKKMIGKGYHQAYGTPHAEIQALNNANNPENSTLYVTLEPCCHHGKTPPCTNAILQNKISHVFYALKDPNPKVSGKGIKFLRENNVTVTHLPTKITEELNAIYLTQTTQKRPFIHLKNASTLDGFLATTPLTNSASNQKVHRLRAQYDAVLVGIQTILNDNPSLTVRHTTGENPLRIVLDSQLRTPQNAALLTQPGQTILATTKQKSNQKYPPNVKLLTCQANNKGQIDLSDLLKQLFAQNIGSILVEGGEKISASFLKNNLVDQLTTIYTPQLANHQKFPTITASNYIKKTSQLIKNDLWVDIKIT